jgi:hypothetical protein
MGMLMQKVRCHEGANLISREVNPDLSQQRTFSDLVSLAGSLRRPFISWVDAVCPTSKETIRRAAIEGKGKSAGQPDQTPARRLGLQSKTAPQKADFAL